MKKIFPIILVASVSLNITCTKAQPTPKTTSLPVTETTPKVVYSIDTSKIIWQDEFNYVGKPDSTKWNYDIGGHGWGNHEKQYYTNLLKNSRVENGMLVIEAVKEEFSGSAYTSARLVSKNKADFTYGRFEIKAKLPKCVGTWPAIWMLASKQSYGSQYWPDNGEIDIMEHVGYDQDVVHGNVHTKAFNHSIGTNKGNRVSVAKASDEFHLYALNWLPNKIEIEVDGKVYFTFEKNDTYSWQEWPFDKPFHLLLNIAIGGDWGGQKGIDDSVFPQKMEVDYVRVYGLK